MSALDPFRVVFFDIGNTLGTVTEHDNALQLVRFDSTQSLLLGFGTTLGLKLGIISNSGPFSTDDVRQMLQRAGMQNFFEAGLVITSADAGVEKPDVAINNFASKRAGMSYGRKLVTG